ncbi:hypothetical protein, partial [Candidatus Burkholderia verschuerenii]|uniref:hypothetical protein n=1 Tax=Candidatus Burkholderia verschuerenii TaxID=242163 RepID=UPI001E34D36B
HGVSPPEGRLTNWTFINLHHGHPCLCAPAASAFLHIILHTTACTLSEVLIVLGTQPSQSTLCEELIHAIQFEKKIHAYVLERHGFGPTTELMEYLAARVLVTREHRWRIPLRERIDNRRRLRRFLHNFKTQSGGLPWHLRLKLRAWTSFLATELEFWMGSYLTETSTSTRRRKWSMKVSDSRCA